MFHSAWNNYVNFGSDIGGYRTGEGPLGRMKGNERALPFILQTCSFDGSKWEHFVHSWRMEEIRNTDPGNSTTQMKL